MIDKELWKKCAEFHGHECPGLTIGYRASLYAAELLGVEASPESGVSCVAETDKCPGRCRESHPRLHRGKRQTEL